MYEGRTKKFRDTIHGYIDIPDIIVSNIIDTEQFQRLKYVEQTSMRSLYPAARHDRFIHSLGVYWLGKQAFTYFRQNSQQVLSDKEKEELTETWWNKQEVFYFHYPACYMTVLTRLFPIPWKICMSCVRKS